MVSHSKDRFSGKLLKSCNYTIERARIMYHKSQSTENMTIKSSRMDDVYVGNKETTSSFVKTWKLLHQRKSKIIEFVNEFSFFIILLTQTYFHILNLENMIHAFSRKHMIITQTYNLISLSVIHKYIYMLDINLLKFKYICWCYRLKTILFPIMMIDEIIFVSGHTMEWWKYL